MPGFVAELLVAEGDPVEEGTPLLVLEAMKMQNEITAPCSGIVKTIAVAAGDAVQAGDVLLTIQ
jgi:pyruvate carboxylase subunit B